MSAAPKGIFIAGTDTGVGKTVVATAVIRTLVQHGLRVAAMKPVAAGAVDSDEGLRNADALALAAATNVAAPYDVVNPYCFAQPVSPHLGAADTEVVIDLALIKSCFEKLAREADVVVVEGAGGWLTPIGPTQTMADIAIALELPVLLVVGLRLGCLNHALLTALSIEGSGARLVGWVGNPIEFHFERSVDNVKTLERRLGRVPLDILPFEPLQFDNIQFPPSAGEKLAKIL